MKMNFKKYFAKLTAFAAAAAIAVGMTGCSENYTIEGGEITTADVNLLETDIKTSEAVDLFPIDDSGARNEIFDREGGRVEVPASINTIISTAPSITEILVGLGLGSKIIAADMYSADVEGIDPEICTLDFYNLNIEELIAIEPDLVIISGMSMAGADDPYAALKNMGVNVIYIPTSNSIDAVKLDIEFIAGYTGTQEAGAELIAEINSVVAKVSEAADGISEKRSVYFEIGAAPYLYSCGSGTFIDEVISLIGAENIYSGESGWLNNSEESVIAADPDVIITSVAYEGYDFNEIKTRPGWEGISAVQKGNVYSVDPNATSRPSQHITEGIKQIAAAVYPEVFEGIFD